MIVTYNNISYISLINNNANYTPSISPASWSVYITIWTNTTTYSTGSVVFSVPAVTNYISIQNNNLNHIVTDKSWWNVYILYWSSHKNYNENDLVIYNYPYTTVYIPIQYMSLKNSNNNQTPGGPGVPTEFWYPLWNNQISYTVGDKILYMDIIYESLIYSNLNHIPSSDSLYWKYPANFTTVQ